MFGVTIKSWKVSYYLADVYHGFSVDARTEAEAITNIINRIPEKSLDIMHDFKIERLPGEWN